MRCTGVNTHVVSADISMEQRGTVVQNHRPAFVMPQIESAVQTEPCLDAVRLRRTRKNVDRSTKQSRVTRHGKSEEGREGEDKAFQKA